VTQPGRQVLVKRARRAGLSLQQLALVVRDLVGFRGHVVRLVQRM
jgi:hypothetical protein